MRPLDPYMTLRAQRPVLLPRVPNITPRGADLTRIQDNGRLYSCNRDRPLKEIVDLPNPRTDKVQSAPPSYQELGK